MKVLIRMSVLTVLVLIGTDPANAQQGDSPEKPPVATAEDLAGDWIWYGPAGIGELTYSGDEQTFQLVQNNGSRSRGFKAHIEVSSHEGVNFLVLRNDEGKVTYRGIFKLMEGHFWEIPPSIGSGHPRPPELRDWHRADDPVDLWLAAARNGDVAEVKRRLKEGIDPNTTIDDSLTALSYASAGGHLEVIQLLLKHGSDVRLRSGYWGHSAVDQAALFGHTKAVEMLVDNGASLQASQPVNHTGVRRYFGNGPLHEIAYSGNAACLDLLLEKGADINGRNRKNETPLMIAVMRSRRRNGNLSDKNIALARQLIERKADLSLTNADGSSALDYAKARKLDELVKLLSR